ncbi:hypothetical protein C0995_000925 [Termitomyces sp. Mi166|nr:hypothetical protein C0995_000925 [Termitomyces sp. Mi166\
MSLYLCVDCGGSKTSAVICDSEGTILARALGGPSNFANLTFSQFTAAVSSTVQDALRACPPELHLPTTLPPTPTPFAAASFGVSGVDSPAAISSLTPPLSTLLNLTPAHVHISNDTHLLASPLLTHPDTSHAVAVIAGTGSIAVSFAQRPDGSIHELARVGGWGWILGDEGGGFNVGREAVRQILLDFDRASVSGRPPAAAESVLTKRVLETFGVTHVPEILPLVYLSHGTTEYLKLPREKRLSSLSPLVFEAAFDHNDAFALRILKMCAGSLAEQVAVLLGDGAEAEDAPRTVKAEESVISFGGSLVGIDKYRALVLEDLKSRGHVFRYVEFVDDAAAVGAVGLAAAARLVASSPS